jgi:predicted nuclease with TOPRIM domain
MEEILKIFGTDTAVAIAWICTVGSFLYALVQKSNVTKITQKFDKLSLNYNDIKVENSTIQQKFESLEISYRALQVQNTFLEQKIVEIENNDIHDNHQEVHQNGQNNFNQGVIKGDFVYNK